MTEMNKWVSAWCSIQGSSHIDEDSPCQDFSLVKQIAGTNLMIAAISDGAGSCVNSHYGSQFLVTTAIEKFAEFFKLSNWVEEKGNKSELTHEVWRNTAFKLLVELRQGLAEYSQEKGYDFKSLSATIIIAVSDGNFLGCANIGDGRATVRKNNGDWEPTLIPVKGEEANQTIFITSDLWIDHADEYFGSFFYDQGISAFSILSDGCERAAFEILKYKEEEDKYYDPNRPFKPFFEPNYQNLLNLKKAGMEQGQINALWTKFIDSGNQKLVTETDDKSIILSAFIEANSAQTN